MNNCVTVWIQNALDALNHRIQQLSNYTEILSLYYNWDALNIFDFPNIQYTPVPTRGILYQGFYGNQLLNVYTDDGVYSGWKYQFQSKFFGSYTKSKKSFSNLFYF